MVKQFRDMIQLKLSWKGRQEAGGLQQAELPQVVTEDYLMDKVNIFFIVLAQLPVRSFISSKFIWQFAIRFKAEGRFKINLETKLAQLLAVMCPRSGQRYTSRAKQFCSLFYRDPEAHLQELSVRHFSPILNSHLI